MVFFTYFTPTFVQVLFYSSNDEKKINGGHGEGKEGNIYDNRVDFY